MVKASKVRITKCYLIEICDKEGNELQCDYSFVSYQDTKKLAQQMKDDYNREIENNS